MALSLSSGKLCISSYNSIFQDATFFKLQRVRGSRFWKRDDGWNDSRSARWKMIKFAGTWKKRRGEEKEERKSRWNCPGKRTRERNIKGRVKRKTSVGWKSLSPNGRHHNFQTYSTSFLIRMLL